MGLMSQNFATAANKRGDTVRDRQEDAQYRILRVLEEDPALSQRQIANVLGFSLGRLNYSLRALLDRGLIKVGNFRKSDRKISYAYLLTPQGAAEKAMLAARFLRRQLDEYDRLRIEIEALQRDLSVIDEGAREDKKRR